MIKTVCKVGDPCLIPGWGRSPGEGIGNPLQYPCLENPMERGTWGTVVNGVTESDMTQRINTFTLNEIIEFKKNRNNVNIFPIQ